MARLTDRQKQEMLEDARSITRRDDFRRLRRNQAPPVNLQWLETITKLIKVTYPRHLIKTDKNLL